MSTSNTRRPSMAMNLDGPDRPRLWGPRLARRIAPVPAAIGLRHALDPGRGRTAVPIRSTVGAIAVTVVALTAALTFRSGAVQLLDSPALYGGNPNGFLGLPEGSACNNVTLVNSHTWPVNDLASWQRQCTNLTYGTTADWETSAAVWEANHPQM